MCFRHWSLNVTWIRIFVRQCHSKMYSISALCKLSKQMKWRWGDAIEMRYHNEPTHILTMPICYHWTHTIFKQDNLNEINFTSNCHQKGTIGHICHYCLDVIANTDGVCGGSDRKPYFHHRVDPINTQPVTHNSSIKPEALMTSKSTQVPISRCIRIQPLLWQKQVSSNYIHYMTQLLTPALNTCFWHNTPSIFPFCSLSPRPTYISPYWTVLNDLTGNPCEIVYMPTCVWSSRRSYFESTGFGDLKYVIYIKRTLVL